MPRREIGGKHLVKAARVDGELGAAVWKRRGCDVRAGKRGGEVRLERSEVLPFVTSEAGHVDETDDITATPAAVMSAPP
jgi:hypothetical protein